jgi:hypothetical protein
MFFEARGYCYEMFEFVGEHLDEIALSVASVGWVSEALPIAFGVSCFTVPCLPNTIQRPGAASGPIGRIKLRR